MGDEESVSSQCNLGGKLVIKVRIRNIVSLYAIILVKISIEIRHNLMTIYDAFQFTMRI